MNAQIYRVPSLCMIRIFLGANTEDVSEKSKPPNVQNDAPFKLSEMAKNYFLESLNLNH